MATKDKKDDAEELLSSLKSKIEEDRKRLSTFLTKLIASVDQIDDPLTVVGASDAVAKIGEALTRQNHLTIEALKIVAKRSPKSDKDDDIFSDVGRPFQLDDDASDGDKDGSN